MNDDNAMHILFAAMGLIAVLMVLVTVGKVHDRQACIAHPATMECSGMGGQLK